MQLRLLLLLCLACFRLPAQTCLPLSDTARITALPGLDDALSKNRLFLLGEVHGCSATPKLLLPMLKYLHREARVRHLVVEHGLATAYLFNRYLETGDEQFVRREWEFGYNEYVDLWRGLYAYNQTQPDSLKIDVIGIDFEVEYSFACALEYMKPAGKTPPASIAPLLDSLHREALLDKPASTFDRTHFTAFQESMRTFAKDWKSYFGEHYLLLKRIAQNEGSYQKMSKRDMHMAYNFALQVADHDAADAYFGSLGWSHTYLAPHFNGFASYMTHPDQLRDLDDTTFANKVLSIGLLYNNCKSYYRNSITESPNILFELVKKKRQAAALNYFFSRASCPATLVPVPDDRPELKSVREQCSYLIVLKDHGAVTFSPYKK